MYNKWCWTPENGNSSLCVPFMGTSTKLSRIMLPPWTLTSPARFCPRNVLLLLTVKTESPFRMLREETDWLRPQYVPMLFVGVFSRESPGHKYMYNGWESCDHCLVCPVTRIHQERLNECYRETVVKIICGSHHSNNTRTIYMERNPWAWEYQ